jgi:hypothetical protein
MNPHNNPLDVIDDELIGLSDPAFVEAVVTSDPFIDWNVELAINGIHLSREEGARIFLQIRAMELQDPIPTPPPALPSNLPDLWWSFVNSEWRRDNEHEPKVAGYSVLRQMLVQQPDPTDTTYTQSIWVCGVPDASRPTGICGQEFRRWDRAITHIRGRHLDHRPYPCVGGCGVPTWYVTSPFDHTTVRSLISSKIPAAQSVLLRKRIYISTATHRLRFANGRARALCLSPLSDHLVDSGRAELRQNMMRHKRRCPARVQHS